ncbi:hypothetical protein K438DRAFT_1795129 [Mycena galopus ATCC 62051]|nr:hypothetical protein K438DRAFT_1795129 [Mycena galopus ATCC 62051]
MGTISYPPSTSATLAPPPASITRVVVSNMSVWGAYPLSSMVLRWFTDLHRGVIESLDANNLPASHPMEFKDFLDRFGASLSEIKLSFSGDDAVQFLDARYFNSLRRLKHIVFNFRQSAMKWLPKILAQLPPSTERIHVFNDPSDLPRRENAATWSEVDQILGGTPLSSLHNFTVVIRGRYPQTVAKHIQETRQLLPCCAKTLNLTIKSEF